MAQQQRRSVKNVVLTKKYHLPYTGTSIFMSLSLLFILYGIVMYRFLELFKEGADLPFLPLTGLTTVITGLIGAGIVAVNVLAAHRIAGVHIKLLATFGKVQEGDFTTRLRFRKEDKLEAVEEAFNSMMDAVEAKVGATEASEATGVAEDES